MCVDKEIYPPPQTPPNNLQTVLQEKDCKTTRNNLRDKGCWIWELTPPKWFLKRVQNPNFKYKNNFDYTPLQHIIITELLQKLLLNTENIKT